MKEGKRLQGYCHKHELHAIYIMRSSKKEPERLRSEIDEYQGKGVTVSDLKRNYATVKNLLEQRIRIRAYSIIISDYEQDFQEYDHGRVEFIKAEIEGILKSFKYEHLSCEEPAR